MKIAILSLALVFLIAVGCCATLDASPENEGEQEALMRLNDPEKPIRVSPGQAFAVVLGSNPTTGYTWLLGEPPNDRIVKLLNSRYVPGDSHLSGAGGKEVWIFIAHASGRTTITFQYRRPWEKDVTPIQEVVFTIIVREE